MDTPYSLVRLEEVGSTQDVARASLAGTPVLVIADRQTAGRGRSGSDWETAPRAVAASLALPHLAYPSGLTPLVAGLAMARITDLSLKWPNDLTSADGKVGGILCEGFDRVVVVGIGVNLWWPDAPAERAALRSSDPGPDLGEELITRWADEFMGLLELPPWPRDDYRRRCVTLGRELQWDPDGRGRAIGIADDGGLIVSVAGQELVLRSGTVRHVRDGDPPTSAD
jgi:BirA family biotin operon repressor/biotin-[acetyl-CoA-carboxylase] ligase